MSTKKFDHVYSLTPTTFNHRLPLREVNGEQLNSKERDLPEFTGYQPSPMTKFWEKVSDDPLNGKSVHEFFYNFPLTNSRRLSKGKERPKKVRMLASDFIEDSLYNPNYGYFPQKAEIFQIDKSFNYPKLQNIDEFVERWKEQYEKYGKQPSLQLWHTPVELFQPHYGESIARYLLVNYKLNLYPYNDLVIYEIGGGNGTLMVNILNYIKKMQPEVYKMTRYKIVEITKNLSEKQERLKKRLKEHGDKVEIINKSFLDWDQLVPEPCFILGLEVLDNLAHDMIKYDIYSGQPYQGYVVIDEQGDFHQVFSADLNEYTANFLKLRSLDFLKQKRSSDFMNGVKHPLAENRYYQMIKDSLIPYQNSLSKTEFIPTRAMKLFEILNSKFPEHQLVLSDFDSLPNVSEGYNSPLVQTMLQEKGVTTSTFMVDQGFFDIMFPTDFHLLRDLYVNICGKLIKNVKHKDFLEQWGDVENTTTKSGENPMLSFYKNASFLHS